MNMSILSLKGFIKHQCDAHALKIGENLISLRMFMAKIIIFYSMKILAIR